MKKYVVGDKTFIQKAVVWGQVKQLIGEIEGVELPSDLTPQTVMTLLEEKLPRLIAIVLTVEGQSAKDKDIDELAEMFKWELGVDQVMEIIEDFFDCNPIPLWFEKISQGAMKMTEGIGKFSEKAIGLTETSQSLQEVTSPDETA